MNIIFILSIATVFAINILLIEAKSKTTTKTQRNLKTVRSSTRRVVKSTIKPCDITSTTRKINLITTTQFMNTDPALLFFEGIR